MMEINEIRITGSRQIDSKIARVATPSVFGMKIVDTSETLIKAIQKITKESYCALRKKEIILNSEARKLLQGIAWFSLVEKPESCDLITEAVLENEKTKLESLEKISNVAQNGTIVASRASSTHIKKLFRLTRFPKNLVGGAFFKSSPSNGVHGNQSRPCTSEKTNKLAINTATVMRKIINHYRELF